MAEIKNSQVAIQISQNQSPISFLLSMKTLITFGFVWTFFGYNWVYWAQGRRSRGHNLGYHDFCESPRISNILEARLVVTWDFLFVCFFLLLLLLLLLFCFFFVLIYSKGTTFKTDRKKILISLIDEPVSATMALFW